MTDIILIVAPDDKPLVWLRGEVKTPPFPAPAAAGMEVGWLLRRLRAGEKIGMPRSRPMLSIGPRCHERRVTDADKAWRLVYRIDADAIVIADVFQKTTARTPTRVIDDSRRRLRLHDAATRGE
ncbi:MAG TPA: type II toxin-antitoxin system RelE/ParE family toxin [Gemmatimonadaceae bacterium]|nr:type II toxin-antitoxin system RelE/ParE family toxin [Gemmatimonadaceae bacterium]